MKTSRLLNFFLSFCVLWGSALFPARVRAEEKPEIKSVLPMGVRAGRTTTVRIFGEKLAPKSVTVNKPKVTAKLLETKDTEKDDKKRGGKVVTVEITVPADSPKETLELTLEQDKGAKANVCLVDDVEREEEVKKPNATYQQAMPISGPSVAISGALEGENVSRFRLEAKAGETWEISLLSSRAGSKLDPVLRVRDRRHLSLALSAGSPKKDRRILFRPPADGTYYLELMDGEGKTGGDYAYRLTVLLSKPPK